MKHQIPNYFHRGQRILRLLPVLFLCPAISAAAPEEYDELRHETHEEHEDLVQVSPEVLEEFAIELDVVGPQILHEEILLPGEIQFNRETLALATPRYAGTVQCIGARLADRVSRGQVLATFLSTETLRPFELKAPIDGTVVAWNLTPGQTVDSGTAVFTLAALSTVWADLRIYQRDMGRIRKGQSVLIENGHDMEPFRGTIAYIAPVIDEHTRTGLARVVVENPDGRWKPGQFVTGRVVAEEHPVAVAVPRTAVLTYEGAPVVFRQTPEGFVPTQVELGHRDSRHIEVINGLQGGEIIAVRNAISLKAELGKSAFGGHAGHVH